MQALPPFHHSFVPPLFFFFPSSLHCYDSHLIRGCAGDGAGGSGWSGWGVSSLSLAIPSTAVMTGCVPLPSHRLVGELPHPIELLLHLVRVVRLNMHINIFFPPPNYSCVHTHRGRIFRVMSLNVTLRAPGQRRNTQSGLPYFPSRIAGCEPTPRADPAITYFAAMLDVERRVGVSLASVLAAGACAGDAGAIHRGYSARAERDVQRGESRLRSTALWET